jgi:Fic family protein
LDVILDMRQYEASHPFLNFNIDLTDASVEFWMKLGEARSKIEHIRGVPLQPSTSQSLHVMYLAKGIHGTTAIEGNTLTEDQVKAHIEGTLRLPDSQAYQTRELDNIIVAFNLVRDLVFAGDANLTANFVCQLNTEVLRDLEFDDDAVRPGEIRTDSRAVGAYLCPPAEDCEYLLERMCDFLNGPSFASKPGFGVGIDILKALVAHLYLVWVHPFGDGNGRTARVLEAAILMQGGVPTPAAHLLSNHYHHTRDNYYRFLNAARRSNDDLLAWLDYAVTGLVEQLHEQIEVIRKQQLEQAWLDHVDATLGNDGSAPVHRQRLIARELGHRAPATLPKSEIPKLTAELAVSYSNKTPKTLSRDVNALEALGLIESGPNGWKAGVEIVEAFLPRALPGAA